jgi:hypothetical protein
MKKVTYCLIALLVTLMVSVATVEPATGITSLFFGQTLYCRQYQELIWISSLTLHAYRLAEPLS